MLDSSGSLKKEGWDAVKGFGANLVKALGAVAKIGVLQYSGPPSIQTVRECGAGKKTPKECGCEWLTDEMSEDSEAVVKTIEGAEWMKGSTLTSMALSMAKT